MASRRKSSVAADYRISAEREQALGLALEAAGDAAGAEPHYAAARHFADKADYAAPTPPPPRLVAGEVAGSVIPWGPKDTLREPDQVALDASAQRKALLLGPQLDVCALGLDTAQTIGAANSLEKMLAHQMALAHELAFRFANRALATEDAMAAPKYGILAARLMDTFQRGVLAIQRLRSGNTQTVTVQHVHVHGGQTVVAGTMQAGGRPAAGDKEPR